MATVVLVGAALVGCSNDGEVAEPVVTPQTGWEVTVYETAVEHFHDGPPRRVTGCVVDGCVDGRDHIGYYPSDFVDAVEFEGSGYLDTGRYAGSYLNWSHNTGFWIDELPRDSDGAPLVPFATAAAYPGVLPRDTVFHVVDCGQGEDGNPVPTTTCQRLQGPEWTVSDEPNPGFGEDERRVALYVGNETAASTDDETPVVKLLGAELATSDGSGVPDPFSPGGPATPAVPGPGPGPDATSTTTTIPGSTRPTVGTTTGTGPPLTP
jgi:hypothetical protein